MLSLCWPLAPYSMTCSDDNKPSELILSPCRPWISSDKLEFRKVPLRRNFHYREMVAILHRYPHLSKALRLFFINIFQSSRRSDPVHSSACHSSSWHYVEHHKTFLWSGGDMQIRRSHLPGSDFNLSSRERSSHHFKTGYIQSSRSIGEWVIKVHPGLRIERASKPDVSSFFSDSNVYRIPNCDGFMHDGFWY